MTIREALNRALATFVAGAVSTPLAASVLDLSAWKVAAAAGLGAVVNLAGRLAQAYLDSERPKTGTP